MARYARSESAPVGRRRSFSEDAPLKERVYSTWYRIRYGWLFRSSVDIGRSPVWLLGQCYHVEDPKDISSGQGSEGVPPHIIAFMEHYYSLTWMTYRANFDPIPGTMLTTDCGWGCMIRSGQMMLATALHFHLLGRDWRLSTSSPEGTAVHKQILSWFADVQRRDSPFSLYALMEEAKKQGNKAGDWFGPSQVAVLLRECVQLAAREQPKLESLLVYVAHDCTVYVGDLMTVYAGHTDKALLVLVPVRLGSEALNPIYIPCVKSLLSLDHCVGIIGGKPKHSVYFVGFQDEKLIHLDPHYCQLAVDTSLSDFDVKSYHCSTPRKLLAEKMDPSCTIGFYCRNLEDFQLLQKTAERVLAPPLQRGLYPFFTFSHCQQADVLRGSAGMHFGSLAGDHADGLDGTGNHSNEDFLVVECGRTSPHPP